MRTLTSAVLAAAGIALAGCGQSGDGPEQPTRDTGHDVEAVVLIESIGVPNLSGDRPDMECFPINPSVGDLVTVTDPDSGKTDSAPIQALSTLLDDGTCVVPAPVTVSSSSDTVNVTVEGFNGVEVDIQGIEFLDYPSLKVTVGR